VRRLTISRFTKSLLAIGLPKVTCIIAAKKAKVILEICIILGFKRLENKIKVFFIAK
jgi:hypothetical protein